MSFRLKQSNFLRCLHEKCMLIMFRSVSRYVYFISCMLLCLYFSVYEVEYQVSVFSSLSLYWENIVSFEKTLNKLQGVDHNRTRNNPPVPSEVLGKIDLFQLYCVKRYIVFRSPYIKTCSLK